MTVIGYPYYDKPRKQWYLFSEESGQRYMVNNSSSMKMYLQEDDRKGTPIFEEDTLLLKDNNGVFNTAQVEVELIDMADLTYALFEPSDEYMTVGVALTEGAIVLNELPKDSKKSD